MAFVYQAQRNLDFSTNENNTLGPGSYISQGAYKIDPSPIPFNTTALRDTTLKNPSLTLGPGAYETNRKTIKPDHMGRIKNSASFSSHINRFKLPGNPELIPGPGSYNILTSYPGPKPQILNKKDPLVLSMPTVPSIPSQSQAFGYDETEFGDLIKQKNPNDAYSGNRYDSVGPGQYNPKPVVEIYGKKGPAWHKSNSKREFLKTSGQSSLGPGTYTIDKSQTVYKLKSSAAFVSTCKRDSFIPVEEDYIEDHKFYNDEDGTPGPGHYYKNYSESYNPKTVEFQKFGSGSKRFIEKVNKMPGPGQYLSFKNNLNVIPESKAPFSSTDPRFTEKIIVTPGPGHYDFSGRIENTKKNPLGKEKAFGYNEPRFVEKNEDILPGPGQYDHDNKIGVHNTAYHKISSVFASKVEKNQYFTTSAGPPPWSYNIPSGFSPKEKPIGQILVNTSPLDDKVLGFTSKEERLKGKKNDVPGPGTYYKTSKRTYMSEPKLEKNMKFGSKQERFTYKKDPFPGPGSYPNSNPWNKKTFNIQFSEFN
ncbi:hypothetical protein SteCoe_7717 [Stentor coeruleus]|uniref:Uncharacterized protein n=1 Tax=Stentor coeruleus TaxID=5963 RepID=A0A1R2CM35_9CILI|nr:hypothetical protein SteCoe_7717 [Stentor coeruleus]